MSDEPKSPLAEATDLLDGLCADLPPELKPRGQKILSLLAEAQRHGEGRGADAVRQQMAEMVQTNAQFVSVMAHDLRIPMTSIRGYADMLAKNVVGELNPMQLQFAETIRANVIRMEHLVSDVSDISKLHSGRIRLEPKADTYASIAQRVEKELEDLKAERSQSLVFDTAADLPPLNLDSARLAQVLNKLLINALRYTPEGSTITVKAEKTDGAIRVSVVDSGIGLTDEEKKHIGELFWRSENEHVRSFRGHGLGLPIAMGLVKLFGGSFFFESEAGKGSTFGFQVAPEQPA